MISIYRRTYRLHMGLRLFLLVGGLGLLIVPVMMALNWKTEQSGPLEGFFGAVLVLFGVLGIGEALVSRRVTPPVAIEQVDVLYRATVPWSEIDRIEVNPYGFVNLMLKHPAAAHSRKHPSLHGEDKQAPVHTGPRADHACLCLRDQWDGARSNREAKHCGHIHRRSSLAAPSERGLAGLLAEQ